MFNPSNITSCGSGFCGGSDSDCIVQDSSMWFLKAMCMKFMTYPFNPETGETNWHENTYKVGDCCSYKIRWYGGWEIEQDPENPDCFYYVFPDEYCEGLNYFFNQLASHVKSRLCSSRDPEERSIWKGLFTELKCHLPPCRKKPCFATDCPRVRLPSYPVECVEVFRADCPTNGCKPEYNIPVDPCTYCVDHATGVINFKRVCC